MDAPPEQSPAEPSVALAQAIAREFRRRLQGEYVPRLRQCIGLLDGDLVWQRPSPNCNSVGNLLLHLAGNTTQWILACFGDCQDARNRPAEFAATGGLPAQQLIDHLSAIVDRACDLVDALPPTELLRPRVVQAKFHETGLSAVLHVLEHFSGHAGQIYAWTKQATGKDLRFYDL